MRKAVAAMAAVAAAGSLAGTATGDGNLEAEHAGSVAQVTSVTPERPLAARATAAWDGEFKPPNQQGSTVKLKAAVRGGEATNVKRFRYLAALMQCAESGQTLGNAGWIFTGGINVRSNRRFSLAGRSAATPQSTFKIKGRFSKNLMSVRGTFSTHQWFEAEPGEGLPAEYCNLAKVPFRATR